MSMVRLNPVYQAVGDYVKTSDIPDGAAYWRVYHQFTLAAGASVELTAPSGRGLLLMTGTGDNLIFSVLCLYFYENRYGRSLVSLGRANYTRGFNVQIDWGSISGTNQKLKVTNAESVAANVTVSALLF